MKYIFLIFVILLGDQSFGQQVVVTGQPLVVQYPVIVYEPTVMQQERWIRVVENKVVYVEKPVVYQGYWVLEKWPLLCKERWRYVPYNY